jgi:hypothetical protein
MAGMPRAIGTPTVDDSTLTYKPERIEVDGKPGGPRLAWPINPVKRFIATGRCEARSDRTASGIARRRMVGGDP